MALDYFPKATSNITRGIPDQDLASGIMPVFNAILAAGGLPMGIPEISNAKAIADYASLVDGICIPGGLDVYPRTYGQSFTEYVGEVRPEKDVFEMVLVKKAIASEKPILGICRGMQLVNVVLGGELIQDIPKLVGTSIVHNLPKAQPWLPIHTISIRKETSLYETLGKESVWVNSFHHQALSKIGDGLEIVAHSEDGIVEAVECKSPWILGVQYHPELMYKTYPDFLQIFVGFVNACNK